KRDSRKDHDVDARLIAGEFEQFVAIAARGDLDGAAAFLADRRDAGWTSCEQARQLTRLGNYQRYGVGVPEEIDVSDLDATDPANWTGEQIERARRACILEDEDEEEEEDEEYEEYDEEEGGEAAVVAEADGAMAIVNFVNFTPPGLPRSGAADAPMATGNFVNFTLPGLPGSGAADAPMATGNFVTFPPPILPGAGDADAAKAAASMSQRC